MVINVMDDLRAVLDSMPELRLEFCNWYSNNEPAAVRFYEGKAEKM